MDSAFTPAHRGGSGPPLVCLHGFTDTWRTWELVLPALERHHDVLAPTLAGHAGRAPGGAGAAAAGPPPRGAGAASGRPRRGAAAAAGRPRRRSGRRRRAGDG